MVLGKLNHGKLYTPRRRSIHSAATIKANEGKDSSISRMKVVVRCRPPNEKEAASSQRNIIKFIDDQMLVFDPRESVEHFFYQGVKQNARDISKRTNKHLNFVFDNVFNFESTNKDIYEICTRDLLEAIMTGYNCSVFVYGATGAGKTHTMLGNDGNPGITYLTMVGLFDKMQEYSLERTFDLAITYVEVYNENVHDLLKPSGQLHLREEPRGGVIVSGVSVHIITSAKELLALLEKGNLNRTQHPTDANAQSSRSHAVFQVHMRMTTTSSGEIKRMKLSMIDLAGSERASATVGLGARFKEGANINKSLLALGNCINSLADGHNHIPYRDSKLTRLLKDSLGGNCKTVMIANISPANISYEDTYNTLKYATRAKNIKTSMTTNIVTRRKDIGYYVERVNGLEKEIELLKIKLATFETSASKQQLRSSNNHAAIPEQSSNISERLKIKQLQDQIQQDLSKHFYEVKIAQEKILLTQSLQKTLAYRSNLKNSINARLNDIFIENSDYDDNNSRIIASIGQFQRQMSGLDARLLVCRDNYQQCYTVLHSALEKCKNNKFEIKLNDYINTEVMKLNTSAMEAQLQHSKKLFHIERYEMENFSQIFIKGMRFLFRYYKYMKGHGLCNLQMEEEMNLLRRQMEQGFKCVSWEEDQLPVDSELAQFCTLTLQYNVENIEKDSEDSTLDATRTISDLSVNHFSSTPHGDSTRHNFTPIKLSLESLNSIEKPVEKRQPKISLFKNFDTTSDDLCGINNKLLEKIAPKASNMDLENDFAIISDTDHKDVEKTFIIPSNKNKTGIRFEGKRSILTDQRKNDTNVKGKIFKSPKFALPRFKKENKENVLCEKSRQSYRPGTMGTASRFSGIDKISTKPKKMIQASKTTLSNHLERKNGQKPSPTISVCKPAS